MTFKDLQNEAEYFKGAVVLNKILSRKIRVRIKETLLITVPLLIAVGLYFEQVVNTPLLIAVTALAMFCWLVFFIADSYFDSFYLQDAPTVFDEIGRDEPRDVSFEIASIVLFSDDLVESLLESQIGMKLIDRLGVDKEQVKRFVEIRQPANFNSVSFPDKVTFSNFVETVINHDDNLKKFLFSHGLSDKDIVGSAKWVERETLERKKVMRWWGRDMLSRIKGVGKDWGYGKAYKLLKYGSFAEPYMGAEIHDREVDLVEAALSRYNDANALLLASDIRDTEMIVGTLVARISKGNVLTPIEHKRVFIFNIEACVEAGKTKEGFEAEVMGALDDALKAEEMIVVIENIYSAGKSAEAMGADLSELLRPYLESNNIQLILCGYKDNAQDIEKIFAGTINHLEKIYIETEDESVLFRSLEQHIGKIERQTGLVFTYGALKTIVKTLESYADESSRHSAMMDLVEDVSIDVIKRGERIVVSNHVYPIVTKKTGIRQGLATKKEKDILLHMEKKLGERVVGQEVALEAVAGALRRARAGIGDSRRPMGSFLFLGPTGVGKTETAKALSEIYFGADVNVTRLDMSEYANESSLDELVGSLPGRSASTLTSILREHMTGVLLLDEFEKAHPKVHNLFLQILDEGYFTDSRGKKISLRNCIIIATSNAASEKIFDMVNAGVEPNSRKDEIIDSIVHSHVFSPELLNRFDNIAIFHPLGREDMREIARLMLERLQTSLRDKGFDLKITDKLISYVAVVGSHKEFGARALRRVIQDKLEEHIAKKIIAYDIQPGTTITINPEELGHVRV